MAVMSLLYDVACSENRKIASLSQWMDFLAGSVPLAANSTQQIDALFRAMIRHRPANGRPLGDPGGRPIALHMGREKGFLGLGGRRVSRGWGRRWKLMLDLLYLLSLMSLRAEDFVGDSEEFPTASAPDTPSSITSRGPIPKPSQTGWHPKHRYCPNHYVHVANPSWESALTLRRPCP